MKIHFVSGLPRSGSSLLVNILAQNPRIHVTGTSVLLPTVLAARQFMEDSEIFKAWKIEADKANAKRGMLRGAMEGYFAHAGKPINIDKSRGWPASIEMLEDVFGAPPKILAPVRDMRDVLASFEKLYRKNKGQRAVPGEKENYLRFQTVADRCDVWSSSAQPLGYAWNVLKDALDRGKRKCIHFVEFEKLAANPKETMDAAYAFLEEPPYHHDFDNVVQATQEDDTWHGYDNLHTIRQKVAPIEPQWPSLIGENIAQRFGTDATNFWRKT